MSVKEIVTLQVGHYSNFIGTHWWNLQESSFVYRQEDVKGRKEVCHDVLFREGHNLRREVTFTPRLVAFDLKGSLKSLKQEGSLYDQGHDSEEIKWVGDVTMHKEEQASKNEFLKHLEEDLIQDTGGSSHHDVIEEEKTEDTESVSKKKKSETDPNTNTEELEKHVASIDSQVDVWSDFLRTHLHPKSVQIVNEYRHNDELRPFDLFSCASEVLSSYESTCEWEDRLHHFTEECDQLQGFHVLMDTHNGFGGLGAGLLCHLQEEYPGKGILSFGFTPADCPDHTAAARASRIINSALAFDKACELSSFFVPATLAKGLWRAVDGPVSFQNLLYKSHSYHTGAILASALDTLSLPYRLDANAMGIRDITHSFNFQGRKMGNLCVNLPLDISASHSLIDYFSNSGEEFPWQSLTPHMADKSVPLVQSVVLRGLKDSQVKSSTDPRKLQEYLIGSKTREEVLQNYLSHKCAGNLFATTCLETALKTSRPYPHIFTERVQQDGFLGTTERPPGVAVESVPLMTSLQCSTGVGGTIQHLHDAASKMNIKKHHRYLELGLEEDEYSEVLDNLAALARTYNTESEGL